MIALIIIGYLVGGIVTCVIAKVSDEILDFDTSDKGFYFVTFLLWPIFFIIYFLIWLGTAIVWLITYMSDSVTKALKNKKDGK